MIISVSKSETKGSDAVDFFNSLSISDRLEYLADLVINDNSLKKYKEYIKLIRKQAVVDAWDHERDLIEQGACTRDWTPEQIEKINVNSHKPTRHSTSGF